MRSISSEMKALLTTPFRFHFIAILIFFQQLPLEGIGQPEHVKPILFYPFSGNAADESGNGNNGKPVGVINTKDRFGRPQSAFYFNGKSYVSLPTEKIKNTQYTYVCWVSAAKIPGIGEAMAILSIGDETGRMQSLSLSNAYSKASNVGWSAAGLNLGTWKAVSIRSRRLPEMNKWYQIASVRTLTSLSLFVDGILVDHVSFQDLLPFYGDPTTGFVGIRSLLKQGFKGIIDDLAIYDVALSAGEIKELYDHEVVSSDKGSQKR